MRGEEAVMTVPAGPRWTWGEACEASEMVNCQFGERGACRNARHRVAVEAPPAESLFNLIELTVPEGY